MIRACGSVEELRHALAPIFHYFGATPDDGVGERLARVLPPERMHAAWEDGTAVGGAGSFAFELTVPGGRVPAAGVTVVGVLPTHRRRGLLTAMMRAQLDDVHERGEPVAYLWSSDDRIYGRYGYGMGALTAETELVQSRGAFAGPVEPMPVRLVSREEALELFPAVYERVAAQTPGMFVRTEDWWDERTLSDSTWRRQGGGDLVHALVDGEAYALYRIHQGNRLRVVEAVGATPAATAAIWRFLLDVDWIDTVAAELLPLDHPLVFLLAEPRRLGMRVHDGIWVRLVDVGAALAARAYAGEGEVVLGVVDAFCPWNEGRWTNRGERTAQEADVALDVSALGSVYLGGFTFAELARAGRVEELHEGGLRRADALFRGDRLPWCPEIF